MVQAELATGATTDRRQAHARSNVSSLARMDASEILGMGEEVGGQGYLAHNPTYIHQLGQRQQSAMVSGTLRCPLRPKSWTPPAHIHSIRGTCDCAGPWLCGILVAVVPLQVTRRWRT